MFDHVINEKLKLYLILGHTRYDYNQVAEFLNYTQDCVDDDAEDEDVPYIVWEQRDYWLYLAKCSFGERNLEEVHNYLVNVWSDENAVQDW